MRDVTNFKKLQAELKDEYRALQSLPGDHNADEDADYDREADHDDDAAFLEHRFLRSFRQVLACPGLVLALGHHIELIRYLASLFRDADLDHQCADARAVIGDLQQLGGLA